MVYRARVTFRVCMAKMRLGFRWNKHENTVSSGRKFKG